MTLAVAFALLAGFYAVVTHRSSAPRSAPPNLPNERPSNLPNDLPAAIALTGQERLSPTAQDVKLGQQSLSVTLPATKGTQGVVVQRTAAGGLLYMGKFWFKGRSGAAYLASVTQQDDIRRGPAVGWTATGGWESHDIVAMLHPSDQVINLVVQRAERRGAEAFDVDAVTMRPWQFAPQDPLVAQKIEGSEELVTVPAPEQSGRSALQVRLPDTRGTQGIRVGESAVAGRVTLASSIWFLGEQGKTYVLNVVQQRGVRREQTAWRATGTWQREHVVAPLQRGDTRATVEVRRTVRGGREKFDVGGLRMEAWRFQNGDASPLRPLTRHELLNADTEAVLGGSSTRVDVPAHRAGGVYVQENELGGPGTFVCSAWIKGAKGSTFTLSVRRRNGSLIAQSKPWKAPGYWHLLALSVKLHNRDHGISFVVRQSPRSERGTFNVDAVDIEPLAAPSIATSR